VKKRNWGTFREEESRIIRQKIRSPRSAAIAGIIFSVLLFVGMLLTTRMTAARPEDIDRAWIERWSGTVSVVVTTMPFGGLALIWFTGVIRDRLGDLEDRFFSTVFLGSGIILVVLLFIWGATAGAMFGVATMTAELIVDDDIFIFGFSLMNEIIGNYALRMAGAYMLSIGTIWTRTGLMPRWLSVVTFLVALGFLLFANIVREARFLFPIWVLVVSVYILIQNYRISHEKAANHGSN
jgi:hypothetical protein